MDNNKIIAHFGAEFHEKVIAGLQRYATKWHLSNFEQIDYYSLSCLFTCDSAKYGGCVLKFARFLEIAETEYYMLKDFNGNGLCKVYESDINNGVLLIERIMPGVQLCEEPDQNIRINEFCALAQKLHKPPTDISRYPTYMDWLDNITDFIKTQTDYADLYHKTQRAKEICRSLWAKYTDRLLLHGDLHHENILRGKEGYYAIDPIGVIGDPVFEIPTFILEEIDFDVAGEFDYVVGAVSAKCNLPEQDIRALLFVESCRLNCCAVEDGDYDEVDMNETLFVERMMGCEHIT